MKNLLIYLLLLSGGLGCAPAQQEETQSEEAHVAAEVHDVVTLTPAQFETAGIETGRVTTRNLSHVVMANGVIDVPPQNLVSISAPLGGFVRETELLQGMKIRKGQTLAVIENPEFIQIQQDYLETTSKLDYARQEFERQSELSKQQVNAQKLYQQAAAELKTQEARLAGLREKLLTAGMDMQALRNGKITSKAVIRSPISGSVTTVNVNIGKYVAPTDVMFEIVDTDHAHVELSVFENDIPKVKVGQLVRFSLSNNPTVENLAHVYLINQKIDEDRTVRVHCHLVNETMGLFPHNFVKASIETSPNAVASLPDAAIVDFEGKSYIFTPEKSQPGTHHFKMTEVAKGVSENGFTEIRQPRDLAQSEIVVKGAYALLAKMKNSEEDEGHAH